jgi:2-polyprenyl-3-methyl-5-hydroxy-6-metoxy-1,4-benzoquinol methylase
MISPQLTERQQREVTFYSQYADRPRVDSVDFEPVESARTRPWNPYWNVYQFARRRFVNSQQRLLDFGCGIGIAAISLAKVGYEVDGFDLSPDNLKVAEDLARQYDLADRCHFTAMLAEQLAYPDNCFDVIVGIDILHHIEITLAIAEAHRVLKPGGGAVFKEHYQAPLVDPIRQSALVRKVAPSDSSQKLHITEDEHKLTREELALIKTQFPRVEVQRFTLISRLDRLMPHCSTQTRGRLQRIDHCLLKVCPPLKTFAGTVVLFC